ncbi:hypothetical protein ROT00_08290 [Agromyces mediolanus]|uniref:MarR family winged helix-turn-helix transcriptional regulator n=1 Tax=Agromyces mediolanus TaxID=41986 RepID=UPI003833417B
MTTHQDHPTPEQPDDARPQDEQDAPTEPAEASTAPTEPGEARDGRTGTRPFGFWLKLVDRRLSEEMAELFADEGLSRRDWRALNLFAGAAADERLAARLAERPKLAHRLAEHGWIARGELTEEGREARERLQARVDGFRERVSGAVSDEDFATTLRTLEAIARELGWDESQPMPRGRRGGRRFHGERGGFPHERGERGGFPHERGFGHDRGFRGERDGFGHDHGFRGERDGFHGRRPAPGFDPEHGVGGHDRDGGPAWHREPRGGRRHPGAPAERCHDSHDERHEGRDGHRGRRGPGRRPHREQLEVHVHLHH